MVGPGTVPLKARVFSVAPVEVMMVARSKVRTMSSRPPSERTVAGTGNGADHAQVRAVKRTSMANLGGSENKGHES